MYLQTNENCIHVTVVNVVDNNVAILFVCVISAAFLCCLPCCASCCIRMGTKQKVFPAIPTELVSCQHLFF